MASELDKLDPIPETVTLRSGLKVQLESLKARQFFKLLRIITHGAMPGIQGAGVLDLENLDDTDEFMGRLLSVVVLSIPDAEDETIEFLRSMVYPVGLIQRRGLNKQDVERNALLWDAIDAELENPELDDVVTIIEAIVKREAEDIQALGKRLASMFKLAERTGQLSSTSPSPTESTPTSSAASAAPSTSSRRNTGGKTKRSSRSRSVESANASVLSASGSTTGAGSDSIG
jgi:hypothetical protein